VAQSASRVRFRYARALKRFGNAMPEAMKALASKADALAPYRERIAERGAKFAALASVAFQPWQ
jgi:hypothetical protein